MIKAQWIEKTHTLLPKSFSKPQIHFINILYPWSNPTTYPFPSLFGFELGRISPVDAPELVLIRDGLFLNSFLFSNSFKNHFKKTRFLVPFEHANIVPRKHEEQFLVYSNTCRRKHKNSKLIISVYLNSQSPTLSRVIEKIESINTKYDEVLVYAPARPWGQQMESHVGLFFKFINKCFKKWRPVDWVEIQSIPNLHDYDFIDIPPNELISDSYIRNRLISMGAVSVLDLSRNLPEGDTYDLNKQNSLLLSKPLLFKKYQTHVKKSELTYNADLLFNFDWIKLFEEKK